MALLTYFIVIFELFGLPGLVQATDTWLCPEIATPTIPVKFNLELTEGEVSPDGYQRKGILMNGQFPGPKLELCQGDEVEFQVWNQLPYPVTVHFHGENLPLHLALLDGSDEILQVLSRKIHHGLTEYPEYRRRGSRREAILRINGWQQNMEAISIILMKEATWKMACMGQSTSIPRTPWNAHSHRSPMTLSSSEQCVLPREIQSPLFCLIGVTLPRSKYGRQKKSQDWTRIVLILS
jgi:hypothetical protein